jgi:MFS family permease
VGSAFTWAGAFAWLLAATPGERRGEVIGTAMGAAVVGALLGPAVGAAAALLGRDVVFTALAGLAVVFAVWTLRIDPIPPDKPSLAAMRRALRDSLFVGGLVLMALPSFLFGVLSTLAPLHLAAAGWGAAAIAVVFVVSACVETVISPVAGRVLDRRGVLFPVSVALTAAVPVSVGLAFGPRPLAYVPLIVLAGGAYGALFTPAFALIAEGAERSRLAQGMAFGLMNAAWAMGALIGPVAGGAVAAATGDVVPYLVSAGFCAVALAAVRRAQLRTTARAAPSDVAR